MTHPAIFVHAIRRSHFCSSLFLLILAGLLLPAATQAQVTYTGSAASQNFGSQAIGSPSAATTFSFSVTAGTTVGSIAVVTQGAPGLDFANATGSTCAAQVYASATTCKMNVTFTPESAGLRRGAVVFYDASGNMIATQYIFGTGVGPLAVFANTTISGDYTPGKQSILGSGFRGPNGVSVDASGNVFVADGGNNAVKEIVAVNRSIPPSPTIKTLSSGFNWPYGVAVDGAGNVFVGDRGNGAVKEIVAAGGYTTVKILGSGFRGPNGVAVDGYGNVFVADWVSNAVFEIVAAGGYTTVKTLPGQYGNVDYVAVDANGNVFVADFFTGVKEILAAGGYTTVKTLVSGMGSTSCVAVDPSGNLFITNWSDGVASEILASGGYTTVKTLATGFSNPNSLTVDGYGNVFISDQGGREVELNYATPPSLAFAATPVGGESSDSPQKVTLSNTGNAPLALTAPSYPEDFSEAGGDPNTCTGLTSLKPGLECDLPVTFTPLNGGALNESVTLTDNALNLTGATQSIALNGTAIGIATHFSVTGPSNAGANAPFTITVTALNASGTTATGYTGTVSFTSTDGSALLPPASKLTAGIGTFRVTLKTLGNQTVTATDAANSLTGTSAAIDVSATPPGVFPAQSSVNLGSQAIGSSSGAQTLSFTIGAGTTVGSIAVVTQGAPNLDFTEATGSTCAAQIYSSASTCTVNVTFTPKFAGVRMGAVVFFSAANNTGTMLGSVPVYGTGTGAQIAYSPSTAFVINPTVNGKGLYRPEGMAEDGGGDLFIADSQNQRVIEVPAGGGAAIAIDPMVNGVGLGQPFGIAADGAGDLFIADSDNGRVVEVPVGGGPAIAIEPTVNGLGLSSPVAAAVDGAGDLFITDDENHRVVEVPAGGGAAIAIDPGLFNPEGVTVDGAGDLFIADFGNNRVVKVPAGGGAAIAINPTVNGVGLDGPFGIAVDGAGDLFITDAFNNRVVEVPAGGGAAFAIDPVVNGNGFLRPSAVAVDETGNLLISDTNNNRVVEVQRSQAPALHFPTATPVGATDTTDGTQTVQLQNIGNQPLTLTALTYPADFSEATGDPNACTNSTSLAPGLHCEFPVEFTPQNTGPLSETISLTSNALNVTMPQQSIALTGTAFVPPTVTHFSVTTTATVVAGKPFSVTISALTSSNQIVTSFAATISFTSSDPSFTNPGPLTLSSGTAQTLLTLNSQGTQSITVTDASNPALSGSANFLVNPPPPPLAFSATSLSFGSEALGYSTPSQNVILTNNTSSAIAIASIKFTGADPTSFVTSNNCGTSLPAAATCRIGVRFVPAALGPTSASVTVTDTAPTSPQSVSLSGTGISAPAASLSLSAISLSFGTELGGQSTTAQNVTVTNTSSSTSVYFNRITLAGANASSFVTSNTCGGIVGGILAPGATCRVGVRFVPQAGGPLAASITLTDNAAASPQTIALSGTGIGPLVSLSATSIPFGNEPLGDSSNSENITLSNTGYLPLDIASIHLTGANLSSFATSNTCGLTLVQGASCKIGVRFIPGVQGPAGAAITVTDNAPDSPQTIALSGTGITPPPASLSLSTTSLAFGNQTVGTSTAAQNVIVTNTSTTTLYFKTITLAGVNPSSFVTSNTCNGPSGNGLGGSLAPGAQCRIGARFVPKAPGPLAATITLTDSAADSPQTITLTGTGQ